MILFLRACEKTIVFSHALYGCERGDIKSMRKLLRDKYSTILLITGFVLSCFVAVNVLTMMNEVKNQQNRKSKSDYKNTKNFEREMPEEITKDKIEKVVQELHTDNGNVFIYGYYSFVGSGLYNPCIYLIVSENEKADRQFIWGRMPNEEERRNKENVIAAGTNMNPYIQEKDGEKYIEIDSTEYKVVGSYESYDNLNQENNMDICTYYECADEKLKHSVADLAVFNVKYGSSVVVGAAYNNEILKIENVLDNNGINESTYYEEDDTLANIKQRINQYFMYLTFIFTLINCMVISNIWIKRRYNELVIRRTYGYGMADIIKLVLKDLAVYGGISMIIGIILQTVYAAALGKSMLKLNYAGENLLFFAVILGIIIIVSGLIPVLQIRKIVPASDIRHQR